MVILSRMLKQGRSLGVMLRKDAFYYVAEVSLQDRTMLIHGSFKSKLWMLLHRLGYPSLGYLKHLFASLTSPKLMFNCEFYILANSHKHIYPSCMSRADKPFMLIHFYVWEPTLEFDAQGFFYYVLFIDGYNRMNWVYFLKQKSEVFKVFMSSYKMIQTHFQTQVRVLRLDKGRIQKRRNETLDYGVLHQITCHDIPQQIVRVERKKSNLT